VYRYTMGDVLRTRLIAAAPSAQGCSRRINLHLLDHTEDLDIENCCFTILHQLVVRLESPLPAEMLSVLERLALHRGKVCTEELQVNESTGKDILNRILNGGGIPDQLKGNEFAIDVQRLARWLRWMACTLLPEVYQSCREEGRRFPEASTLYFLWSAVEDVILHAWVDFVLTHPTSHLSLHFDGLRVAKPLPGDPNEFCRKCSDHIFEATGFAVRIRPKKHASFLSQLQNAQPTKCAAPTRDSIWHLDGNCIPLALSYLIDDTTKLLASIQDRSQPSNVAASSRRHRTYQSVQEVAGVTLVPITGLSIDAPGHYLIHSECAGEPHCFAATREGDSITIRDSGTEFVVDPQTMQRCLASALDRITVVTFVVYPQNVKAVWPTSPPQNISALLLDLQAGGRSRLPLATLSDDLLTEVACSGSVDECDRSDNMSMNVDDESVITVGDALLGKLKDSRQQMWCDLLDVLTALSASSFASKVIS